MEYMHLFSLKLVLPVTTLLHIKHSSATYGCVLNLHFLELILHLHIVGNDTVVSCDQITYPVLFAVEKNHHKK